MAAKRNCREVPCHVLRDLIALNEYLAEKYARLWCLGDPGELQSAGLVVIAKACRLAQRRRRYGDMVPYCRRALYNGYQNAVRGCAKTGRAKQVVARVSSDRCYIW